LKVEEDEWFGGRKRRRFKEWGNGFGPETGSRIPSISTGGAAMNAIIKTEVAVKKVGIIKTPNHPM
jgi:hypothetical protein